MPEVHRFAGSTLAATKAFTDASPSFESRQSGTRDHAFHAQIQTLRCAASILQSAQCVWLPELVVWICTCHATGTHTHTPLTRESLQCVPAAVSMMNGSYVLFPALSNTNYVYDNSKHHGYFWLIWFSLFRDVTGYFFPLLPSHS